MKNKMKSKLKLTLFVSFASAAILVASQAENLETYFKKGVSSGACYTEAEVTLLMKAHRWSKQEAETILKLACQFSDRHK